jgi:hypothetical protein
MPAGERTNNSLAGPDSTVIGVGHFLGPEEERAGACLYRPLADVEGHLALEDVETLVLEVVDVEQTLFLGELRNEYLYQGVPTVGLLPRGLDGGQPAHPPPRLAFPRTQREGQLCGFFSGEHGPPSAALGLLSTTSCVPPVPRHQLITLRQCKMIGDMIYPMGAAVKRKPNLLAKSLRIR